MPPRQPAARRARRNGPLPARLWLDVPRDEWCVLDTVDGQRRKLRSGCGEGDRRGAEAYLADYVQRRDREAAEAGEAVGAKRRAKGSRRAEDVPIAEVIAWGLKHRAPLTKRPSEYAQRMDLVLDFADEDGMDVVDRDWCAEFAAHVGSPSYARRALEDFRASVRIWMDEGWLKDAIKITLPDKSQPRPDYLTLDEVRALVLTAWRELDAQVRPHGPKNGPEPQWLARVVTSRRRWRHLVPYIVVSVLTCSRAARVYEASYVAEPGRPWVDLDGRLYYRLASGEVESAKKRAPTIPLGDRLVDTLRRWSSGEPGDAPMRFGRRYLVQYAGRPVDCRKAFEACLARTRLLYPHLFRRPDGSPKIVVRHTLRHTGVTLLSQWGVPADDVCEYAGMSREVYDRVYKHLDPDHMASVMKVQGGRARRPARGSSAAPPPA